MKSLSRIIFAMIIFIVGSVGASFLFAAQEGDSLSYNGVTYKLPLERDKIKLPANLPEQVSVKKGDTLWDIAGTLLKDNFLWPLIWENNMEQIPNPHLIYPDQVIKMPNGGMLIPTEASKGTVTPGTMEQAKAVTTSTAPVPLPVGEGEMTVSQYIANNKRPLGTQTEMEACGFITPKSIETGSIVDSEMSAFQLTVSAIVYINLGENDNVKAGDIFTIFNYDRKVNTPKTNKYLGRLVSIKGRLKVLCAHENNSTGIISKAYDSISVGDKIMPYEPIKPINRPERPKHTFCKPSTGSLDAVIVDVKGGSAGTSDGALIATNDIVYLDKGKSDGVQIGQYFATYKHRYNRSTNSMHLSRISIGELLVIKVENKTSSALVTNAKYNISIGDKVDVK